MDRVAEYRAREQQGDEDRLLAGREVEANGYRKRGYHRPHEPLAEDAPEKSRVYGPDFCRASGDEDRKPQIGHDGEHPVHGQEEGEVAEPSNPELSSGVDEPHCGECGSTASADQQCERTSDDPATAPSRFGQRVFVRR